MSSSDLAPGTPSSSRPCAVEIVRPANGRSRATIDGLSGPDLDRAVDHEPVAAAQLELDRPREIDACGELIVAGVAWGSMATAVAAGGEVGASASQRLE